jgi:hypothetical protein
VRAVESDEPPRVRTQTKPTTRGPMGMVRVDVDDGEAVWGRRLEPTGSDLD